MDEQPFISIVVAAFNAEKTIRRCIEALLRLEYTNYDITIVDNNSDDRTANIAKEYDVRYLLELKKGWPAARNSGIFACNSRYVANIDADCYASPSWLKHLVSKISGNDVGVVVGKTVVEKGRTLAQRFYAASDPFNIERKISKREYVPWGGGNNIMLREAFVQAGGYKADLFLSGADVEFHYRLHREHDYKTIYASDAVIFHEARGSVGEFFRVSAKYSYDGVLRSREENMKLLQGDYRLFILKNLYQVWVHFFGLLWRSFKAIFGHDTLFRVMCNVFRIINLSGEIYGYLKGRIKHSRDSLLSKWKKNRISYRYK